MRIICSLIIATLCYWGAYAALPIFSSSLFSESKADNSLKGYIESAFAVFTLFLLVIAVLAFRERQSAELEEERVRQVDSAPKAAPIAAPAPKPKPVEPEKPYDPIDTGRRIGDDDRPTSLDADFRFALSETFSEEKAPVFNEETLAKTGLEVTDNPSGTYDIHLAFKNVGSVSAHSVELYCLSDPAIELRCVDHVNFSTSPEELRCVGFKNVNPYSLTKHISHCVLKATAPRGTSSFKLLLKMWSENAEAHELALTVRVVR